MGSANNWAERYRAAMIKHPFGHAFYEPPKIDKYFGLGKVGYIDDQGHWHLLVDLADKESLTKNGYTEFRLPVAKKPDFQTWGPVRSANVSQNRLTFGADVDAAALGLPVECGGAIEYQSESRFTAVLMCDDKVEVNEYDARGLFITWLRDNARTIWKLHKHELGKSAVHLVTRTYTSKAIFIRAFGKTGEKAVAGFKVGAAGLGSAKQGTSWVRSSSDSHWRQVNEKEDNVKKAIFFKSVKLTFGRFGRKSVHGKKGNYIVTKGNDAAGDDSCEALIQVGES